jgi:ADP-L-glycero-D-manno-heptose 6-epimerase
MWIVTGGAGFIGSNLVEALNQRGESDILIVDHAGKDSPNLHGLRFADMLPPEGFLTAIERKALPARVAAILHQGACADTTCTDERYMMDNNVHFSKAALGFALERKVPFVYASSAAVYGGSAEFRESPENERPLNLYGRSKLIFDNHVRALLPAAASAVVGLRYFNVYGPREKHKGRMASMVYQLYRQLRESGRARLFEASGGYAAGEQRRDFVSVRDAVDVNLFFAEGPARRGIFNVGTGRARSFNEIVRCLAARLSLGRGEIEYIPFPEGLREKYQNLTQADLSALRAAGYTREFTPLEDGIASAVAAWNSEQVLDSARAT